VAVFWGSTGAGGWVKRAQARLRHAQRSTTGRALTRCLGPPPPARLADAKAKAAHEFKEYSHCLDITG
jgi:hypothetical protein